TRRALQFHVLGLEHDVVDVVSRSFEQDAANELVVEVVIFLAFCPCDRESLLSLAQLLIEQVGCFGAVFPPPAPDSPDLGLRFCGKRDLQGSASSSSRNSPMFCVRPAFASAMPRRIEACRRLRSSLSRSSPFSAMTILSLAPSGKFVGSSTTIRPFS